MESPPAFQFYAEDFLTGVIYLTNEEVGMYIRMLCKQWTDGKIPKKRLGLLVGYDWEKLSETLKSKFVDHGEYVINKRLEQEREKKSRFLQKQRENGKLGGRPPKNQNPNETQKKPLEDEIEVEYEDLSEKGGVGEKTKYAESVLMTNAEYQALIEKHGQPATKWMIDKLNNYKISRGKAYKSDYRAILSWVVAEYEKREAKPSAKVNAGKLAKEKIWKSLS